VAGQCRLHIDACEQLFSSWSIRAIQGGWAVSPAELREALGALSSGGFGLSDMHDAAEVLGELFACLHRCASVSSP
jgi:hypothetical protein